MATYYFCKQDYRTDMQRPSSSARMHAVCRRLVGSLPGYGKPGKALSLWYGAFYWAASGVLGEACDDRYTTAESQLRYFRNEVTGGRDEKWHPKWERLYWFAVARCRAIAAEAVALESSVLW